jgi:hypothetical protein
MRASIRHGLLCCPLVLGAVACSVFPGTQSATFNNPDAGIPFPVPFSGDGGLPTVPPTFGNTVIQNVRPPAISGGTLLVTADGNSAIAADPDRDEISVVDLASRSVRGKIMLQAGDEPGRSVEDAQHRIHTILRNRGALLTFDPSSATVVFTRTTCANPRGVAYHRGSDRVVVACATGELLGFSPAGGDATVRATIASDLRDVVPYGDTIAVTRFRSAELLVLDAAWNVATQHTPPRPTDSNVFDPLTGGPESFSPSIAWRTIPLASPSATSSATTMVAMVHQEATTSPVNPVPGGYGQLQPMSQLDTDPNAEPIRGCTSGVVRSALTIFGSLPDAVPQRWALPNAVLPVDIAVSADRSWAAVAAAGNGHTPQFSSVIIVSLSNSSDFCTNFNGSALHAPSFQATAVAITPDGLIVAQSRQPSTLALVDRGTNSPVLISLAPAGREDTGHAIFHSNAGAGLACASCHPEGRDDGRVWNFAGLGGRRSPSLRGTIEGTAPYHWGGEEKDLGALIVDVFSGRMSGGMLLADQSDALSSYVRAFTALPTPPPSYAAQAAAGAALFSGSAGCGGCHNGPSLTNNLTLDVGTGGAFQVPSLIGVRWRAPYLHDGCAATLGDRFLPACGGDKHGTQGLDSAEIEQLVTYLETL